MRLTEARASTACSPSRMPGLDWALNPYKGCQHGCLYCYSADVLRLSGPEEWGSFVEARRNIPNLLARERKDLKGVVGIGTVTDPYQPAEERLMLTRYCLQQLSGSGCGTCVQTKSHLVTRDIDILSEMRDVEVGITVTTMDADIAKLLEPGAPPPDRRVRALAKLSDARIRTWLFLGPVIPGINDSREELARVVEAARSAGAGKVLYDWLRLKPILAERMARAIGDDAMGGISGQARDREWRDCISRRIEELCREGGIKSERGF